tara:strand:- start:722 stop:955 length:234 start_codon:yes stop_codon:yes gene_type:complete
MPVYTIRNDMTEEIMDVNMSYKDFQDFLHGNPEYSHIFKMPATVSGRMSTHRMAGEGWQDVLKKVKKGSGKDAKINV